MHQHYLDINKDVHGTVELSRRSVARALPYCKGRDTRERSALVNCYIRFMAKP